MKLLNAIFLPLCQPQSIRIHEINLELLRDSLETPEIPAHFREHFNETSFKRFIKTSDLLMFGNRENM